MFRYIFFLVFFSFFLFAQEKEDSLIDDNLLQKFSNLDYERYIYCDMTVTKNIFGKEEGFNCEYGLIDSIWKQNMEGELIKLSQLKKKKTLIDALNLMGFNGWSVIHTYTSSENSYIQEHYIFQKKINKIK